MTQLKLTEPGIYACIPMDAYLGDLCPGPSISGSGLALIDRKTPAHWFATSYLNPDRVAEPDTAATAFGTAAHTYILEGADVFAKRYAVKPEDLNFSTKDGKAWRAEMIQSGKEIISAAEYQRILRMAAALRANPKTARLLENTRREMTIVWQDAETGIWLKARPDALNDALGWAINLKTCEDADEKALRRSVDTYDYYVSAAVCIDGLRAVGWRDAPGYAFVFVEKDPPNACRKAVVHPAAIEWGRLRYRRALQIFADCLATGKWPGYDDDEVVEIDLPPWAERDLQARHEAGEFTPVHQGEAA